MVAREADAQLDALFETDPDTVGVIDAFIEALSSDEKTLDALLTEVPRSWWHLDPPFEFKKFTEASDSRRYIYIAKPFDGDGHRLDFRVFMGYEARTETYWILNVGNRTTAMTPELMLSVASASSLTNCAFIPSHITNRAALGYLVMPTMIVFDAHVDNDVPRHASARGIPAASWAGHLSGTARGARLAAGRRKLAEIVASRNPDSRSTLAQLRMKAGISQTELAERIGMHQPNVARMERSPGDVGVATIRKIQLALDVTLDQVIEAIEETNSRAASK